MSERILLGGGELRRGSSRRLRGLPPLRPRRRRGPWLLLAALVVLGLAVVMFTAGGNDGRGVHHGARGPTAAAKPARHAAAPRPSKPLYGATPAPAAELVRTPFRQLPHGGLLFDLRSGRKPVVRARSGGARARVPQPAPARRDRPCPLRRTALPDQGGEAVRRQPQSADAAPLPRRDRDQDGFQRCGGPLFRGDGAPGAHPAGGRPAVRCPPPRAGAATARSPPPRR